MAVSDKSLSLAEMPLINGRFDFFPDTTSITTAVAIGVTHACVALGTTGAATISRQAFTQGQTAVPGEPVYYLRWNNTTAATALAPEFHSKIEDVRTFQGKKVCVQGYYRSTASSVTVGIQQNFGAGGSPNADVNTSAIGQTGVLGSTVDSAGTAQWRPFSVWVNIPVIGALVIGSTANTAYLAIRYLLPLNEIYVFELADTMIHIGGERIPGEARRPIYQEQDLLDRYYVNCTAYAPVSTQSSNWVPFRRRMAAVPAMTGGTGSTLGTATVDGFPIISTGAAGAITAIVADARIPT